MKQDCSEIYVTVNHPWGDLEIPLTAWIEYGPGPRHLVSINSARCSDGRILPLTVVPLQFRNNQLSRLLIKLKFLSDPWKHD